MNDAQKAFNANFAKFWQQVEKLSKLVEAMESSFDMDSVNWGNVGDFGHAVELLEQANQALDSYRINAE